MKGDFSRDTFNRARRYSGVLMQQGRVQLDADFNEQQEINQYHAETEGADVIGPSGVPKVGGGFQIGVTADKKDFLISPGRMYVDGILCESAPAEVGGSVVAPGNQPENQLKVDSFNIDGRDFAANEWIELLADAKAPLLLQISKVDKDNRLLTVTTNTSAFVGANASRIRRKTTYNAQPDYFRPLILEGSDPDKLTIGRYLIYLDVWQRHITSIEDPHIREIALGGPDTATRAKTVWQVKAIRVGNVGAGNCGDTFANWPPKTTGKLKAQVKPEAAQTSPCVLPPGAGYQRLENQLYRVEVHKTGPANDPKVIFKWSRDNGSVTTAIESITAPQTVNVHDTGRDSTLGFNEKDLVEVIDDRAELNDQAGQLFKITGLVNRAIRLDVAPTGFAGAIHPQLRRWEGADQIKEPANPNDFVPLEGGIQIQFSKGDYQAGDYWLIPARTATSSEAGDIEWPRDDANNPLAESPHGIEHHYAQLALLDFDGAVFNPASVLDCRKPFPPLTAITASDVSFDNANCKLQSAKTVQQAIDELCKRREDGCTLVAIPGKGWEAVFDKLSDAEDANVCFQVGLYPLERAVSLKGKGHLKFSGAGLGTHITASASEAAIVFEGWKSVIIRDLYAESAVTGSNNQLNGALTFLNCGEVTVDSVSLKTAGGSVPATACITVNNAASPGISSVRIRHCNMEMGINQVGILLVSPSRAEVEDNALFVIQPPSGLNVSSFLNDKRFRAAFRKTLVSNITIDRKPKPTSDTPPSVKPGTQRLAASRATSTISLGGRTVVFNTDKTLAREWQELLAARASEIKTDLDLINAVKKTANRLLIDEDFRKARPAISKFIDAIILQNLAAASQGIVVGGTVAKDIRILNNSILGTIQGIHIGTSHHAVASAPPDVAGAVRIAGNEIEVNLPLGAVRERHGIFVGNCDSLLIEGNRVLVQQSKVLRGTIVDGVRIYGHLGRMMIVRQNHLVNVTTGILVNPLNIKPGIANQWLVADNMVPGAQQLVNAPPSVRKANNIS